jgi:hypothetical protein
MEDIPPQSGFMNLLANCRQGVAVADIDEDLAGLVMAINATGKKGTLNVAFTIKPVSKKGEALGVEMVVTSKAPTADSPSTIFYADEAGNLSRHDPRQAKLFEERS